MKSRSRSTTKSAVPANGLDFSSKLFLIGVPAAGFLIIALLLHFVSSSRQWHSVTKTIDRWKPIYHLSEKQADTIRDIELEFHGSGSAFSSRPRRSKEETRSHHEKISNVMNPEFRERFLADMKEGRH